MKELITKLIDMLKNFLAALSKEPDRPTPVLGYEKPEIIIVKGVKLKTHGVYKTPSGKARGLVVHYTVSGKTASSARAVLKYLAKRGLGCMVMDEAGTIYVAENVDLEKSVAWHAGSSAWKGKTGLSRYCMGMEICCWGKLDKVTEKRVKGKIRKSSAKDNIKAGKYEAYTDAQEKSLRDFIMWQLDVNPEFSLDWIVGHDEIAPKRKSDPGASLTYTMPGYRWKLKQELLK